MKRREFMKTMGVGLSGLVGLERLVKAMVGDTAYAAETCDGTKPNEHYCRNIFTCGAQGVTCSGNVNPGYSFECKDYRCTVGFVCRDYLCRESWGGDFECTAGFTCETPQNGQRFDCQGTDPLDAQFNCEVGFKCRPGTRFGCDDFHCNEGNFICSASVGTAPIAYAASIQPK